MQVTDKGTSESNVQEGHEPLADARDKMTIRERSEPIEAITDALEVHLCMLDKKIDVLEENDTNLVAQMAKCRDACQTLLGQQDIIDDLEDQVEDLTLQNGILQRAVNNTQRLESIEKLAYTLEERMSTFNKRIEVLEDQGTNLAAQMAECRITFKTLLGQQDTIDDLQRKMEGLSLEIGTLKQLIANTPTATVDRRTCIKARQPKTYDGKSDDVEVENFLFDMEQYFLVTKLVNEAERILIATTYLEGDAKVWWRTKYEDIQANCIQLDTWERLCDAIRKQFLPKGVKNKLGWLSSDLNYSRNRQEAMIRFRC